MLKKAQPVIIGIILGWAFLAFAGAPNSLTGTFAGHSITLTWVNGSYTGISNLRVYKKSQYDSYAILTNLPITATILIDPNVNPYTFYTYKIITIGSDRLEKESSSAFEIATMTNVSQYNDLIRFENNSAVAGESIKFHYSVPVAGPVEIAILNTALDIIRIYNKGDQLEGTYPADWDLKHSNGTPVQPGMYVISLKAGNKREYKKVVVKR